MKKLVLENRKYKEVSTNLKDEIGYQRQRENKLMYFLFVLKEQGIPIGDVFESKIKDIPTTRFSKDIDQPFD